MPAGVGAVQQIVHPERDGVRHLEQAVAKGSHERAIRLEHDDRMVATAWAVAARHQIHAVVGPRRDARHVAHGPVPRQLKPVFDHRELAAVWAAQLNRPKSSSHFAMVSGGGTPGKSSSRARWQRTNCPGATCSHTGGVVLHTSTAY